MAFQQPTRQATQRVFRPTSERDDGHIVPPQTSQPVEDSQTWVLFSPATDIDTASSYLTSTHKSNPTPGRSRLSDVGSLNTLPRSDLSADQPRSTSLVDALDENDEDDAELDSLDSHLPEFRSNTNLFPDSQTHQQHNAPVVPAHDGLGSFRLDQEGMGAEVQDRLYAFEQYNPRRVKRRRESFELAEAQLREEEAQDKEKMRWIEAWRLEQSRLLLDQIHRETRRRRRSSAASRSTAHTVNRLSDNEASFSTESKDDQGTEWHEQGASDVSAERESIWGRITRKVVRDILGVDDKMLAILFGEALPDDEELASTPRASSPQRQPQQQQRPPAAADNATDANWQLKMLERVAKELGLLIHQLSGHPGAFSTFSRVQQMPLPYAGLPSIPESAASDSAPALSTARESRRATAIPATGDDDISVAIPEFQPTIGTQTRPIDVAHARSHSHARRPSTTHTHAGGAQDPSRPSSSADGGPATFTQEEWEQDLDIRLVFRYLRSRFMPRTGSGAGASHHHHHHHHHSHSHGHLHTTSSASTTSASTQDIAAKAARVRQHHPLIAAAAARSRLQNTNSSTSPATGAVASTSTPVAATAPQSPIIFRTGPASSCASQSTRRSVTATRSVRSSIARRSSAGSSRHYWDIGAGGVAGGPAGPAGSAGTGSLIAATTGPMGSWGEV